MRILVSVLAFCHAFLIIEAQTVDKRSAMVGPGYSYLKYAISFADQVQVAYDGTTDLKGSHFMPPSIAEVADLDYYRGKFGNAAGEYYQVINSLPQRSDLSGSQQLRGSFSLYKSTMEVVDYKGLNIDQAKTYSSIANTVGMLYQTRGKFNYAQAILDRAMEVRALKIGKTSRDYINSLCNQAVINKDLGNYNEAERIFNYLIKTIPKLFTTQSMQYVIILNNKAMLMAELGRTKEAVQLLDEALSIGSEVLSEKYIDYERMLTNRALIEQESGDVEKAGAYYEDILSRMETKGFEDHPDYNNVLVYYGSFKLLHPDEGILAFLNMTSDKVKKRYGDMHLLMAKAQTNLGDYYLNQQSYAEAKIYFIRVAVIQLKLLGDKHKDYLNTLVKLGVCEWHLQNLSTAYTNLKQATDNYLFLLESFFPTMSEAEKGKFWATLKPNVDAFMSFALANGDVHPAVLTDAYNLQLKTKGLLFNATNQTRASILASEDTVVNKLYAEWLMIKNTLASYYSASLEDIAEDKVDMKALESQANGMERELSRRSTLFQKVYDTETVSFDQVRNSLREGEAAIEIVRVSSNYNPDYKAVYAGLIVKRSELLPKLVRIENGTELEKRALAFYKNSIQAKVEDTKSYDTYWKPFEDEFGDAKTIFVSLDGVYNSINLNTLKEKDGNYLLDDKDIVLVPSTRVITSQAVHEKITSDNTTQAVLVGSPAYGNASLIDPLPGTKAEVEKIDVLLRQQNVNTKVLMEQTATEGNMKAISSPSVLHIATHGYFLSDVSSGSGMTMGVQISRAKENPLLRSGLLFAGAASAIGDEPSLNAGDNGILNAYEALNLNLQGTRLVIMSACETGSGEIVNGEGVYGLSRSFQVAGARKIIMSLWKVDDAATQELMTEFYNQWVSTSNPQVAFLNAQREVKNKFSDPYYWGAFVLLN